MHLLLILKIISLISLSDWNLGHCAPLQDYQEGTPSVRALKQIVRIYLLQY